MPHYKDGTEAKIGDIVSGTGYNVKDAAGKPRIISGKVIQVTKAESCNLAVAHLDEKSPLLYKHDHLVAQDTVTGHTQIGYGVVVIPSVEYGATKDFEKIA